MPADLRTDLLNKRCQACTPGTAPITGVTLADLLRHLPGWQHGNGVIHKTYSFKNYYQTMAFVNAIAFIAHREDHHPDLEVGYKTCRVTYSTHDLGGLSANDFICAANVNALLE
jgi:4a-hydroxytetrahydrobiopterin dehydratase